MTLQAIIWDYDGTLVDTREKNLNVSRAIITKMTGRTDGYPALESLEAYDAANRRTANWRELYRVEFGFNDDQIDQAGSLWTVFQNRDPTRVRFFEDLYVTISGLARFPQAIVSQNSSSIISAQLDQNGLGRYFKRIIGYEEVDLARQKPYPDGLLRAIGELVDLKDDDVVLYVGDHETDAQCAHNANVVLGRQAVLSVGALYQKTDATDQWTYRPDYKALYPHDILTLAASFST